VGVTVQDIKCERTDLHSSRSAGMSQISPHQSTEPTSVASTEIPFAGSYYIQERRLSKKVTPILDFRCMASSPHLQNMADDTDSGSPAGGGDKRRNKLGYQRTTIACGKHICHLPPLPTDLPEGV
jgi:hypothetical protein